MSKSEVIQLFPDVVIPDAVIPDLAAADLDALQTDGSANELERAPHIKPRMALTKNLKHPTEYVRMMNEDFKKWAFHEELAPQFKGKWREEVFQIEQNVPLDLEIGTGNGYHFAQLSAKNPQRALLGIELKYKPLIQSIRRALRTGNENARILRYDASCLEDLFADGELNNVYIHFPDPWTKKRQWKHRIIQEQFLITLHRRMRPGSFLDFKTDSRDYFEWAMERFKTSPFELTRETWDLHNSEWKTENFITHFEGLFMKQGLPIHYARLEC